MTEQPKSEPETPTFPLPGLKATFRSSTDPSTHAAPTVLVLGQRPCILIEPEFAEDGDQILNFLVDITDQNIPDAADLLSALADTLRSYSGDLIPTEPLNEELEARAIAHGDLTL